MIDFKIYVTKQKFILNFSTYEIGNFRLLIGGRRKERTMNKICHGSQIEMSKTGHQSVRLSKSHVEIHSCIFLCRLQNRPSDML